MPRVPPREGGRERLTLSGRMRTDVRRTATRESGVSAPLYPEGQRELGALVPVRRAHGVVDSIGRRRAELDGQDILADEELMLGEGVRERWISGGPAQRYPIGHSQAVALARILDQPDELAR